jgi:hypothetical protein
MAHKHYPSRKEFDEFMCSISEDFYAEYVGVDFKAGTVISHQKVNAAVKAFWEKYNSIKDGKGKDYRGAFVMLYRSPFKELELTNQQHKACAKLYTVMQYDGFLKWKDLPMDRDSIGEFLGYEKTDHDSSFRSEVLFPLISANFILKFRIEGEKQDFYKINPEFVIKGNGKDGEDDYFLKVFQTVLRHAIIEIEKEEKRRYKKKKQNSAVGTLHALLPYVHYQTLHFVEDPTVDILKVGESVQDAIDREALKKNRKKHKLLSKRAMRRLAVKGKSRGLNERDFETHLDIIKQVGILFEESSGGNSNYMLFPLLAFSHHGDGKDEYTIGLIKRFFKTWGKNRDKNIRLLGLKNIIKEFKFTDLELKD